MGYGTTQQRQRPQPSWQKPRAATAEWRQGPKRLPRHIPPKVPTSGKERHRMLDATYMRLSKLLGRHARDVKSMPSDRLRDLVGRLDYRQGDARRLLAKILRLEPGRPATA